MKLIDGVTYQTPAEIPDSEKLMNVYATAIKNKFAEVFGIPTDGIVVMWGDNETVRVENGELSWTAEIGSDDDDFMFWKNPNPDYSVHVELSEAEGAEVQRILDEEPAREPE